MAKIDFIVQKVHVTCITPIDETMNTYHLYIYEKRNLTNLFQRFRNLISPCHL